MDKDLVMPIIPCAKWQKAPQMMAAFHRELCAHRHPPPLQRPPQAPDRSTTEQVLELLRHSATLGPLSEHSVHILTDLTTGFRDHLGQLAGQESRERLLAYLGVEGERALAFWHEEYIVD